MCIYIFLIIVIQGLGGCCLQLNQSWYEVHGIEKVKQNNVRKRNEIDALFHYTSEKSQDFERAQHKHRCALNWGQVWKASHKKCASQSA